MASRDQAAATGDRAVALARRFHEAYEEFAPVFDYETRAETRVPWEELPDNNRKLMITVCVAVLHDIEAGRV